MATGDMMHPNTHSEQVVDKNGFLTTRHKRNIDTAIVKNLPTLGSAITGANRTASTTPAQRANFDMATVLVNSLSPEAKTISVVEVEDKLLLAAIDGEPVSPSRTEFLASSLLYNSGIQQGVYKLSGAVDEAKAIKAYANAVDAGRYHHSRQTSLSDTEDFVAVFAILGATDPDDIDYMASDDFGSVNITQLAILNPKATQETIDSHENDEDGMVRAFVARKTKDPELLSRLIRNGNESIMDDAVDNLIIRTEDLDYIYRNARLSSSRSSAIHDPKVSSESVIHAYENDWNFGVIHAAANKTSGGFDEVWENTTNKSYLKDDAVKPAAKEAGRYARSYSQDGLESRAKESILTDDQARAIAWRFSNRSSSKDIDAFRALDAGENFSLQKLVVEAANFKSLRLDARPYGLMWDIDDYSDAIIGWARNKQGKHKHLTDDALLD